jgi:polar amino acid transport system substrate-binding protein
MLHRISVLLVAILTATFPALAAATDQTVEVTTLEWPPYTGPDLPKSGATSEVVTEAFKKVGLDTKINFLPWKRAIAMAKEDKQAIAYYPGYHCHHVEGFVPSDPIGNGPLGFAENVSSPITWKNLDDIGEQKLKIGTVLGYANTDEFDEKAGTGWIRAVPAPDDLTNLKKLMRSRIDAAVIDKLVMSYLLATQPSLKGGKDSIEFNAKPLEEKQLFLCFRNTDEGLALRDKFNEGLAQINADKIVDEYFQNEF